MRLKFKAHLVSLSLELEPGCGSHGLAKTLEAGEKKLARSKSYQKISLSLKLIN